MRGSLKTTASPAWVLLVLLPLPAVADSLQKRYEGETAGNDPAGKRAAVLDAAIQEGLSLPAAQDFASYLSAFHQAYARFPGAWAHYLQNLDRQRLLEQVKLPLSAEYMSLARHSLQSKKTRLGYGLDVSGVFQQDLDRAIVLKNASTLHAFFFQYLAKADLDADRKSSFVHRDLLAALLRKTNGYSIVDYKDIFYFQAPDASADYIDEEINEYARCLKTSACLARLRELQKRQWSFSHWMKGASIPFRFASSAVIAASFFPLSMISSVGTITMPLSALPENAEKRS